MSGVRLSCAALVLLVGCRPEFDDRDWLIGSVRVLAVHSEPAEAKPGESLHFTAFLSAPDDASRDAAATALDWRFCSAPKPPTENNVVSSVCLGETALTSAGRGLVIDAALPADACASFGPDTPPGGFRPRDPDATGGYYQPVRLDLPGAITTFHLQRVTCGLAQASADAARAFADAYAANRNPSLGELVARSSGSSVALESIPPGAAIDFESSWSADSAESYAYYDRASAQLTSQRESLRLAWFVDGGKLDFSITGRAADDFALTSDNRWSAPEAPGVYRLWLVLSDSRGGADFSRYELRVGP